MADNFLINITLRAKEYLSERLKKIKTQGDDTKKGISGMCDRITAGFRGVMALQIIPFFVKIFNALKDIITAGIDSAGKIQENIKLLQNTSGLTNEQMESVRKNLVKMSTETNTSIDELIAGLNTMVAAGYSLEDSMAFLPRVAKTAVATNSNIEDISSTAFSLGNNLKITSDEIEQAFEILNTGAKAGQIEMRDMAQEFPAVTGQAQTLGMKGLDAVAALTSGLEIMRRTTGSAAEAGTNLSAVLNTLNDPDELEKAGVTFGVNLKKIAADARKNGADPLLAVAEAIKKAAKGDLTKITSAFGNIRTQRGLAALVNNLEDYNKIKKEAMSSKGTVDADFKNMLDTLNSQTKLLGTNLNRVIMPVLKLIVDVLTVIFKLVNDIFDVAFKLVGKLERLISKAWTCSPHQLLMIFVACFFIIFYSFFTDRLLQ